MKTCLKLHLLSFLVFLCYTTLSVRVNAEGTDDRYRKFNKQHVNAGITYDKCDEVMNDEKKQISKTADGTCKEENTFIQATTSDIDKVCDKAGAPYDNSATLRISNQPFPVITCKTKPEGKRYPHCQYRGSQPLTVYIVIGCEEGRPVHYAKGVPFIKN